MKIEEENNVRRVTMVLCFSLGPTIIQFPEDTYVEDGEGVLFQVEVSGAPHHELVWYHDGVRVVADSRLPYQVCGERCPGRVYL